MNLSNNMAKEYVENMQRMFSKNENGIPNNFLARVLSYSFLQSTDSFIEEKLPQNLSGNSVEKNRLYIVKKSGKENVRFYLKYEIPCIVVKELIVSIIIKGYGGITPKNKIFSNKENLIFAGSKEMRIIPLKYFQLYERETITNNNITSPFTRDYMIAYGELMSEVFFTRDVDANHKNFFHTFEGKIGKFDHDFAMQDPLTGSIYNQPMFLKQVDFYREKFLMHCNADYINKMAPSEKELLMSYNKIIPCVYFISNLLNTENVYISEPPDYKTVELNINFFTDENINNLMKSHKIAFIFVVWLIKMKQMIDMPKEIIDYMFSEQLLGRDFKRLSPSQQKEFQENILTLKTSFNNHIEKLRKFIRLPLSRLDDLKKCLQDAQIPLPPEPNQKQFDEVKKVIFDPIRKKLRLNLHELKKGLKNVKFRELYIEMIRDTNHSLEVSQENEHKIESYTRLDKSKSKSSCKDLI